MINPEFIQRSFGTHDGTFHADEVTACALLLLFDKIDKDKIVRSRDLTLLENCEYVCDVGGIYDPTLKRFDHHQSNYRGSMSSAGMILKYLSDQAIITPKLYQYLNRSLILGVDAIDNGKSAPIVGYCSFSSVVANFVPTRYDAAPKVLSAAFFEALDFCVGHLRRLLSRYDYIQKYRAKVKEQINKKEQMLLFKEAMPWLESFFDLGGERHPAQFVIMPCADQWKLRAIPPSYDKRMQVRIPLPRAWSGLIDKELQEKSGIAGAIFCHKGQFISIWKTKEDAFKALKIAMGEREIK